MGLFNLPGYGDSATWGGLFPDGFVPEKPNYIHRQEIERFESECAVLNSNEFLLLTENLACNDDFWLTIAQGNTAEMLAIRKAEIKKIIDGGFYDNRH